MHDVGLTRIPRNTTCFEVEGAEIARRFLAGHGMPAEAADRVAVAIVLHMRPSVTLEDGVEAVLLDRATSVDVRGEGYDLIRAIREGVVGDFPRGAFDRHFLAAIEREVAVRPTCQSNRLLTKSGWPTGWPGHPGARAEPRASGLSPRQREPDRSTELLRQRQPHLDHVLERLGVRKRAGVHGFEADLPREPHRHVLGLGVVARDEHRDLGLSLVGRGVVLEPDRIEGLRELRAGQEVGEILRRAARRVAAEPVHRIDDDAAVERRQPLDHVPERIRSQREHHCLGALDGFAGFRRARAGCGGERCTRLRTLGIAHTEHDFVSRASEGSAKTAANVACSDDRDPHRGLLRSTDPAVEAYGVRVRRGPTMPRVVMNWKGWALHDLAMNTNDNGRAQARSRANRRLRTMTIGTAVAGVVATGAFAGVAAFTYDGSSGSGSALAAVTTTETTTDSNQARTRDDHVDLDVHAGCDCDADPDGDSDRDSSGDVDKRRGAHDDRRVLNAVTRRKVVRSTLLPYIPSRRAAPPRPAASLSRSKPMFDQVLWFATRGAGAVSLIMLTASLCFGMVVVTRFQHAEWPRFLNYEMHRRISLLAIVFLAVHILAAVFDPFPSLGLAAALVPLASTYRPIPMALGVSPSTSSWRLIATSLLRKHIGQKTWRAIHWTSYAMWPPAVMHGVTGGTDGSATWMLLIDVACLGAVAACLAWRLRPRARMAATPGMLRPTTGGG